MIQILMLNLQKFIKPSLFENSRCLLFKTLQYSQIVKINEFTQSRARNFASSEPPVNQTYYRQ